MTVKKTVNGGVFTVSSLSLLHLTEMDNSTITIKDTMTTTGASYLAGATVIIRTGAHAGIEVADM